MNKIYALIICILALYSCGGNNDYARDASYTQSEAPMGRVSERSYAASPEAEAPDVEVVERKLIKTGDIRFSTDNTDTTKKIIEKAVEASKGYISAEKSNNNYNTVTIRVPFSNFDFLLNEISKGAKKIDSKDINVSDVTSEYVDIEARVKTKKELENRYKELLKKAHSIEDILRVEREIGVLRADIESMEGRMKLIESQATFSTLTINYYSEKYESQDSLWSDFKDSIEDGWDGIVWFVLVLTKMWAFIILGIGVYFVVRNRVKKSRAKRN